MGILKSLFYHFRRYKRLEERLERYTQVQMKATMIEINEHQVVDIRNGIDLASDLTVEILPSWKEPYLRWMGKLLLPQNGDYTDEWGIFWKSIEYQALHGIGH
jgi:hypothetical protein